MIGILGDSTLNIGSNQFLTDMCLCDRYTRDIVHDESGFIFLELANFVKKEDELETMLDKWLYLLKNISGMKEIPANFQEPIFEKLFNIAEYSNLKKEEKMDYIRSQMRRWDNKNIMDYAIEEGKEFGMKEGMKEGIKEGMKKGIKEGIEKGKQEEAWEIAKELKKIDLPVEQIAKVTKLSVEELEKL